MAEMHGIVLDMDGTLVNSEPLSMGAWNEVLRPSLPNFSDLTEEDFIQVCTIDISLMDWCHFLAELYGFSLLGCLL